MSFEEKMFAMEKERFRRELIEIEYNKSRNSIKQANDTEIALCGQLMLLATVVLSVTGAILASEGISSEITPTQSILVIAAILSLIASIGAGIKYYFELITAHGEWAREERKVGEILVKVADVLSPVEMAKAGKKIEKVQSKHVEKTSNTWLNGEVILIGIGACLYLVLIAAVLFDFTWLTGHLGINGAG